MKFNNKNLRYRKSMLKNLQTKKSAKIAKLLKIILFGTLLIAIITLAAAKADLSSGKLRYASDKIIATLAKYTGFGITQIKVEGFRYIKKQSVVKALQVNSDSTRFNFNLKDARKRLLLVSGVRDASIRWLFPGKLHVTIEEAAPLSLYTDEDGENYVLAQNGEPLYDLTTDEYRHLPIIAGSGSTEKAYGFIQKLKKNPYIYALTDKIERVSQRRWDIILKNGTLIMLPEKKVAQTLELLEKLENEKALLSLPLARIDMRVHGKIAVLPKNDEGKKKENSHHWFDL